MTQTVFTLLIWAFVETGITTSHNSTSWSPRGSNRGGTQALVRTVTGFYTWLCLKLDFLVAPFQCKSCGLQSLAAPQLVLTALGTTDIRCTRPPANLCVFS